MTSPLASSLCKQTRRRTFTPKDLQRCMCCQQTDNRLCFLHVLYLRPHKQSQTGVFAPLKRRIILPMEDLQIQVELGPRPSSNGVEVGVTNGDCSEPGSGQRDHEKASNHASSSSANGANVSQQDGHCTLNRDCTRRKGGDDIRPSSRVLRQKQDVWSVLPWRPS